MLPEPDQDQENDNTAPMIQDDSTDQDSREHIVNEGAVDEPDEATEYHVEKLVNRRRNKSGNLEYEVKWLDYDSSDNTWEPVENLNCPDLISEFNETWERKMRSTKAKQPKKRTKRVTSQSSNGASTSKSAGRPKRRPLILEDDERSSDDTESEDDKPQPAVNGKPKEKVGFEKGLKLVEIIAPSICTDNDPPNKEYFFVKWEGDTIEMIEADELEKHEPRMLCRWFRERQIHQYGCFSKETNGIGN